MFLLVMWFALFQQVLRIKLKLKFLCNIVEILSVLMTLSKG